MKVSSLLVAKNHFVFYFFVILKKRKWFLLGAVLIEILGVKDPPSQSRFPIYAKVVIWLTDKLIFNRISAGTEFTPMMSAIKSVIPNPRYQEYCKLINTKIFARHESGIRDKATQEELYLITELERFIIQSIEMGIIQNETHLINVITKYKIRNNLTIS